MTEWIDITEFASKYGVSASTLRRRIRTNTVEYKMERGKYLLQDSTEALKHAPLFSRQSEIAPTMARQRVRPTFQSVAANTATTANNPQVDQLVNENRRLKAQIAELETLVKALEAELSDR